MTFPKMVNIGGEGDWLFTILKHAKIDWSIQCDLFQIHDHMT